MKRYILFLLVAMLECGIMFSQNNRPLSPMLNFSGEIKRDYKGVKIGTACILQRVIKLKKPIGQEESTLQAVVVVGGVQVGIPMEELDVLKLIPADKTSFWQTAQLSNDLISYYEKKGYQGGMRQEQAREADDYMKELEHAKLFYDDAAIEDYLQCMLLSIIPEKMAVLREGTPLVRVLKSPAPDMLMLGNDCLLVSTGMLTALDSEEELYAVMSREVAHYVLDHAIITVNKNIARAKRAQFWGAVADGVVAATEEYLYDRYDYYVPGLVFATNDVVQALVNDNIANRMGLDYSEKQEKEADHIVMNFMVLMKKNKDAMVSALSKINQYYQRNKDVEALSKYGAYGSLPERVGKLGKFTPLDEDRNYLKKTSTVVSYEAGMMDYNKKYNESRRLAMKNINNAMACSDDYLMVARSIMKLSNSKESNAECLEYLNKADETSKITNVNICKMKILLLLRENKQADAVHLLHEYQDMLNAMYQQPHTQEDAQWIAGEHTWAEKLLDRTYIM